MTFRPSHWSDLRQPDLQMDAAEVSQARKDARGTILPEQGNNHSRLINKYLDMVADKNRHRPNSNLPFHPLVFSSGRMTNSSTSKVFGSWKQIMARGTYNLVLKRGLSLGLLQKSTRSLDL